MPSMLRVDNQGRAVLPKEVRQALGIERGSKLVCRVIGNKVILEKFSIDRIQEAFSRLEEIAPSLDLDIIEVEGKDKHIDREYALRKIGLRRNSCHGTFHAAKAALASENLFLRTYEGTIREFGLRFIKEKKLPKELGIIFSDARSLRETADYASKPILGLDDAKWAFEAEERFLKYTPNNISLKRQ